MGYFEYTTGLLSLIYGTNVPQAGHVDSMFLWTGVSIMSVFEGVVLGALAIFITIELG